MASCDLNVVSSTLLFGLVKDVDVPLGLVSGRNVETGVLVLSDARDLLVVLLGESDLLEVGFDTLWITTLLA